MKQIQTARELYLEILKSFYFGVYRKDDRLMTYQETHEVYGLAKNTIGRAYGMLQRDGFIRTDGVNGTIVTFDMNNTAHMAKVPLEWPKAEPEDTISYEVAMRLHAHSLYTGLTNSNEAQLQACKELVKDVLHRVKGKEPYSEQVFAFWKCAISSLNNGFLSRITDHFISRYLYLLPPAHLSSQQQNLVSGSSLKFYGFLLEAIERREFDQFPANFEEHYHNYYRFGAVVFSKLEDGDVFKEEALYGRVLADLCIKIMSGELQKGDSLPTTKHLCAEYGVSRTTVNRTYGILAEMGFISRRAGSGTILAAEPDDPEILKKLEKVAGFQHPDWKEAIEVLLLINSSLNRRIVIAPEVIGQMREELRRQYKLFECYSTPFFAIVVLLSPIVFSLPAGILHKYYVKLTDVLSRVVALCTFRIHGNQEHGKEVYRLICDALEALEYGNQELFTALSQRAVLRNTELLAQDYNSAIKCCK